MKKAVIISLLIAVCISGCGKNGEKTDQEAAGQTVAADAGISTYRTDTKAGAASREITEVITDNSGTGAEFQAHFNEITVEGTVISIPISCKELETLGFERNFAQKETVGKGSSVTGYSSWKTENTSSFGMDYRFKGTEDSRPLEDCDVVSFLWDVDAAKDVEVVFYGGIHKDSTREEVAALLNEVYADETGAQYSTELNEKGYSRLSVYFDKDQMVMVELYNCADYVE